MRTIKFHGRNQPYTNEQLEKIFYEAGFKIAPIEVDLIRQFSQLNDVVTIKVQKTLIMMLVILILEIMIFIIIQLITTHQYRM